MSIIAAVAIPNLALWLMARIRGDAELRRAALIFIGLTLLWFAPCWLFQATPVPLDFITSEYPWKPLRTHGYVNKSFTA